MEYLTTRDPNNEESVTSVHNLKFTYPIKYYDFHIYYYAHNSQSLSESNELRDKFLEEFKEAGSNGSVIVKKLAGVHAIGPHPTQFWEVDVARPEIFIKVLSWFQLYHGNLSVLVHPQTGDDNLDHTTRALWLGDKLPLLVDVFDLSIGIPEFGIKNGKRIKPEDYY